MPFDFSSSLTEKLFWTFPEFLGKCLLIRNQLALPQRSSSFPESEVSTRTWSWLSPPALKKWRLTRKARGRSAAQSREDCGNEEHGPNVPCPCQSNGKEALHQMMLPGKTERHLKGLIPVPLFPTSPDISWRQLFVFPLEIMQESTAKHAFHLHAI